MRIRQGNDFIFLWAIERNGQPEDFSNATNIRLHFKNFDCVGEVKSFQIVDGNIVRVEVSPEWASRLGAYRLILSYEFEDSSLSDGDRKCVVDVLAFNIVPKTSEADDVTEMAKTTDIMIGFQGLSAYEVWLKDNPDKTKEDYYNWLRQPATDAVSLIDDKVVHLDEVIDTSTENEAERVGAENIRLSNETGRVDAESQRVDNENERLANEINREQAENLRAVAEGGRVDAENIRVSNENARKSNETGRVSAEIDRVNAEGIRTSNENTRLSNEVDRVNAESNRVVAEGLRQTNTAQAIADAEGATVTANTAAQNANDARETIQDDLALKADQADLAQLADEVSLFKEESNLKDAIQDSKIKDIESIISTMNPNQSAQLSVSGRKTISLPKNASNGGMGIKLEGLTAENIFTNGDFSNELTGWDEPSSAYTYAITSGILTLTRITDGGIIALLRLRIGETPPDSVIYTRYRVRVLQAGATSFSVSYAGTLNDIISNPNANQWYDVTDIFTTSSSSTSTVRSGVRVIYPTGQALTGYAMEVDYGIQINLTQTFGAGNEPTKEECDLMFADYFEGVKSFEPTGRVRSDIGGRNLILNSKQRTLSPRNTGNAGDNFNAATLPYDVKSNTTYTISFDGEVTHGDYSKVSIMETSPGGNITSVELNLNGRTKHTFITPQNTSAIQTLVYAGTAGNTRGNGLILRDIKLEKGNKATDWTPAPEDVLAGTAKGTGTSLYLTAPELRSNGAVKDEIRKGDNGYELVKRISDVDGSVLTTPVITPISYGGILNSAENGTVYHEPIIADAGVYDTKMDILLTDYPIATIEEIIKHKNGVDTYLDVASAVIASDGLSFTHPDLADGDLVLFTYAYDKESTNGNITATFYDSNVVKIDTETGKAYKIEDVITNGVLTRILTEV